MIILADGTLEKPREPLPIDGAEDVVGFLEPEEEPQDRAGCVNVFQKGKSHQAVVEARSGSLEEALSSPEPSGSDSSPKLALTLPSALSKVSVIKSATNETLESNPLRIQSKRPGSVSREHI